MNIKVISHFKVHKLNRLQYFRKGNCGYNPKTNTYVKCQEQDKLCGVLQCKQIYNTLAFGMNRYAVVMDHYQTYSNGMQIDCRTVLVNIGSDQADIGFVPNGAKCGEKEVIFFIFC